MICAVLGVNRLIWRGFWVEVVSNEALMVLFGSPYCANRDTVLISVLTEVIHLFSALLPMGPRVLY